MAAVFFYIALLIAQLALLCTAVVFFTRWTARLISDFTDVPFVETPHKQFPAILGALQISRGDTVYELGSGDGRFLLHAAAHEPSASYVGIERNPLLVGIANIRKRVHGAKNVTFHRGNIFDADLTGATKIYAYLLNPVMDRLLPSLLSHFRGRLASRAFYFADKRPSRIVELSKRHGQHGEHLLFVYDF